MKVEFCMNEGGSSNAIINLLEKELGECAEVGLKGRLFYIAQNKKICTDWVYLSVHKYTLI